MFSFDKDNNDWGLWFTKPMTAEEIQEQKLREMLIEVPDSVEEMRSFLEPENLLKLHLRFPATDFDIPGIGECCMEELKVTHLEEDKRLFVELDELFAWVSREDVSLAEWLGLWVSVLYPRRF